MKILKDNDFLKLKDTINQLGIDIATGSEIIKDIQKGNFSADYQDRISYQGMLTQSLLQMRSTMEDVKSKEQQHIWIQEGLAKFAEILRKTDSDLRQLSDIVIGNLVKYLKANQGAIYILNDESGALQLTSCYAYGRIKYGDQHIAVGEGLVGQCFIEKEKILISDIPEDYIKITSGLGSATPTMIAIIPIKTNTEVLGVLEIASFEMFKKHEIEFLEKISQDIASSIGSIKTNQSIKMLLKKSNDTTQALLNQEEEMRQQMEELHTIQEELSRKDYDNRKIIAELRAEHEATLDQILEREKKLHTIKNELLEKLTSNNTLIDVAGRQRMLSQKIGFYAEMILRGNFSKVEVLESAIAMHELSLNAIKNGGIPPGFGLGDILPKAHDLLLPIISKVEKVWEVYKIAAEEIILFGKKNIESAEVNIYINTIEDLGETILKLNNDLLVECSKMNKIKILEMYQ